MFAKKYAITASDHCLEFSEEDNVEPEE